MVGGGGESNGGEAIEAFDDTGGHIEGEAVTGHGESIDGGDVGADGGEVGGVVKAGEPERANDIGASTDGDMTL